MQDEKLPILIVGAGPTGLALALWLKRNGVPFRIVDKSAKPGETSRALAVQVRTLELYRQLGIAEKVADAGIKVQEIELFRNGHAIASAPIGRVGEGKTPYPFVLFLSQDVHERILVEELAALGVTIERSTALTSLTQDENGVTARVRSAKGEEVIRARYVCGCDGSHSVVREQTGIEFPGGTYEQVFFVADVQATGAMASGGVKISLSADDFCIVMPVRSLGSIRLTGLVPSKNEHKERITYEDVEEAVKKNTGLNITAVNWFSPFHVHHRVAQAFQNKRVFLAGDSGHIHSPAGGQGMNTGIGDALNLAWKLTEVVHGRAPETLLSTYEPERIAFARRLVATTDTAFSVIASRTLFGRIWRAYIMPYVFAMLTRFQFFVRFAFRTISQTQIEYRESPLSHGHAGDVHAGDRLPWIQEDNYRPLKQTEWQIHIYGRTTQTFRRAADEHQIKIYEFPFTMAAENAGLLENAFYLVRPDGYVGLASPAQDPQELEKYAKCWMIRNDPRGTDADPHPADVPT